MSIILESCFSAAQFIGMMWNELHFFLHDDVMHGLSAAQVEYYRDAKGNKIKTYV